MGPTRICYHCVLNLGQEPLSGHTMGMYTVWREEGEVAILAQVLYGNF